MAPERSVSGSGRTKLVKTEQSWSERVLGRVLYTEISREISRLSQLMRSLPLARPRRDFVALLPPRLHKCILFKFMTQLMTYFLHFRAALRQKKKICWKWGKIK